MIPIKIANKDERPRNSKGEPHGYWKVYHDGILFYKCLHINGERIGYFHIIHSNMVEIKRYYI